MNTSLTFLHCTVINLPWDYVYVFYQQLTYRETLQDDPAICISFQEYSTSINLPVGKVSDAVRLPRCV